MLFDSSIRKELSRTFVATLVVLLTIVITMLLIRTLSMAAKGAVSPQDVMVVLGYTMLGYSPILLTLAMFVTIVSVLSRMYRDSEMVIWHSAGLGTLRLLRPIGYFAWPVLAGVAVLMLIAWPWSNSQITHLRNVFQQRSEITRVQPGQFYESHDGRRVFFVEQQADGTRSSGGAVPSGRNVFVSLAERNQNSIVSAASAHMETIGGDRFVVLTNGQQLAFDERTGDRTLLSFDRYAVRIADNQTVDALLQRPKELSTRELFEQPTPGNLGELSWRLGVVLATLAMALLAVPLANANPRSGRNTNLGYAVLAFVIYFNLVNLGNNWIARGDHHILPVMLGLHGGMLTVAIFLLLRQERGWRWPWQWRPAAATETHR